MMSVDGPPAASTSSWVTEMDLTLGAAAETAALTSSISSAGTTPPMMMALGTWRALGSALALLPRPDEGTMSVLPEARAGSSARAASAVVETWTTWDCQRLRLSYLPGMGRAGLDILSYSGWRASWSSSATFWLVV